MGCQKTPAFEEEEANPLAFPDTIAQLIQTGCATSGCHDKESHQAAAGLDLSNWKTLFKGSRNNAVVIPFAPDKSPLLFILNRDEVFASTLLPTMPLGGPHLSKEEVELVYQWISEGAPNATGQTALSNISISTSIVILNSLCQEVCYLDTRSGLITRYFSLDQEAASGFPTEIIVDSNNASWCVLYTSGQLRCHDFKTGMFNNEYVLPQGTWRTMHKQAVTEQWVFIDWSGNTSFSGGRCATLDPITGVVEVQTFENDQVFFPYGWTSASAKTHYTSANMSDAIYELTSTATGFEIARILPLDEGDFKPQSGKLRPGNLLVSEDKKSIYVSCERSAEVRKLDLQTGKLLATIAVGTLPQEMIIDTKRNLLYVACTEDKASFSSGKSSVMAIDLEMNQVVETWNAGYQSRGLVLDQKFGYLYVANRNADPVGADAPHHYTSCEGNNGYITRIDLFQMRVDDHYRAEVSVDPYAMDFFRE
ncbi:MAG: hypothetical protein HQ500_02030 [Flavobacteriales bacterium]|nr:hypothetical protein [Flavobacteriales bacterium]